MKQPRVAFLLALSWLWLAHGIANTPDTSLPSSKAAPAQIAELSSGTTFSPILIERDTKAAPGSLMLECIFPHRLTPRSLFEPHAIVKCFLHDRLLIPRYLIYTQTTSSFL